MRARLWRRDGIGGDADQLRETVAVAARPLGGTLGAGRVLVRERELGRVGLGASAGR